MSLAEPSAGNRHMILASDRGDRSRELAEILAVAGTVETITMAEMPDRPAPHVSGIVVDINLRSADSVQRVRNKLTHDAYRALPRLFVLADALHHGSAQAWALGATDTIQRPFDADSILHRIRGAFPDTVTETETASGSLRETLAAGIGAAHAVLVKMFGRLPAGKPLTLDDVMKAETQILKALKHSTLKAWLDAVSRHHDRTYRHCLLVTGFAVAFAQHLGMRDEDQRRLARAALLHDVGKAFVPRDILDKTERLTEDDSSAIRAHARLGYDNLAAQGGFPREVLDVVLHHHELLDGSGYPDALRGDDISDIVRMITIVDIHATLVERQPGRAPFGHAQAFTIMENMGGKLDRQLLQAFRPVAFGA